MISYARSVSTFVGNEPEDSPFHYGAVAEYVIIFCFRIAPKFQQTSEQNSALNLTQFHSKEDIISK
jgi:hypothetical protein